MKIQGMFLCFPRVSVIVFIQHNFLLMQHYSYSTNKDKKLSGIKKRRQPGAS